MTFVCALGKLFLSSMGTLDVSLISVTLDSPGVSIGGGGGACINGSAVELVLALLLERLEVGGIIK